MQSKIDSDPRDGRSPMALGKDCLLPQATRDLEQAESDLKEHGVAIVADALSPEQLKLVRETLYRVADQNRRLPGMAEALLSDHGTQRVWNLPSRDPLFCDLIDNPIALRLVKALLGWPVLLSNISANITEPGSGQMWLHADQSLSPLPWAAPHGLNIIWCVDDYTEANGATRVVPGSHRLNRPPGHDEQNTKTVPVEAPAGSVIAMESRVWHTTGANISADRRRAGIFAYYTLPIFLPQENWWVSLDPAVRYFASDTVLELLGIKGIGPMGLSYGRPLARPALGKHR
jgi:ectoine hydroxylase-related dioxygenase (phytanoyl-CoA dioxygenase family)